MRAENIKVSVIDVGRGGDYDTSDAAKNALTSPLNSTRQYISFSPNKFAIRRAASFAIIRRLFVSILRADVDLKKLESYRIFIDSLDKVVSVFGKNLVTAGDY